MPQHDGIANPTFGCPVTAQSCRQPTAAIGEPQSSNTRQPARILVIRMISLRATYHGLTAKPRAARFRQLQAEVTSGSFLATASAAIRRSPNLTSTSACDAVSDRRFRSRRRRQRWPTVRRRPLAHPKQGETLAVSLLRPVPRAFARPSLPCLSTGAACPLRSRLESRRQCWTTA